MSFYWGKTVLIKFNGNAEIAAEADKVIRLFAETLDDLFHLEYQSDGIIQFRIESYRGREFDEYLHLMKQIDSQDQSGALVRHDSDYWSRIEAYGNTWKKTIEPSDQIWRSTTFPDTVISFPAQVFCDLTNDTPERLEEFLYMEDDDYNQWQRDNVKKWDQTPQIIGHLFDDPVLELVCEDIYQGQVTLEYRLLDAENNRSDFFISGSTEKLKQDLERFNTLNSVVKAKGGNAWISLNEVFDTVTYPTTVNTWISNTGFYQLELKMTNGEFGEFTAYEYGIGD